MRVQDAHHRLARRAEVAFDARDFHRVDKHTREAERDLLRELVAVHSNLEAVAEVDVEDLAGVAVEHEVRRVPVAEAEDVPDHGHDRQAPRVRRPPLEPPAFEEMMRQRIASGEVAFSHAPDEELA